MRADTAAYAAFKARVGHQDPAVRAAAAASDEAPPEVLYYLAQDAAVEVRRRVAANPATPVAANMLLTRDPDHSVRCEIAYKAVGSGLEAEERTRMLRMGLTILETLAMDQVVKVRAALADAIKGVAEAPRQIIRALAADAYEEVAAPVLRRSPVLTDDDLIEVLDGHPPEWAQTAIARRDTVSPPVAEAIADAGSEAPTAELIGNNGASIAEPVLERIVEGAADVAAWQAPLAQREAMPPRLISRLASLVTGPILTLLRQRNDLTTEMRDALVLRERTGSTPGPAARAEAAERPVRDAAPATATAATSAQDERQRAVALHQAGELDDDVVASALDHGNNEFVTVALALRAGMTLPTVQRILSAKGAEVVTAMVWKTGMSMRFAMDVQKFLANVPIPEVLNARGGVDYPLSEDKMTMLLDVFGD